MSDSTGEFGVYRCSDPECDYVTHTPEGRNGHQAAHSESGEVNGDE